MSFLFSSILIKKYVIWAELEPTHVFLPLGRRARHYTRIRNHRVSSVEVVHCLDIPEFYKSFIDGHTKIIVKVCKLVQYWFFSIIFIKLWQVFKFSADGKQLLLRLGVQLIPGNDKEHFCKPTDVAVQSRTGHFFVSDGYVTQIFFKSCFSF